MCPGQAKFLESCLPEEQAGIQAFFFELCVEFQAEKANISCNVETNFSALTRSIKASCLHANK